MPLDSVTLKMKFEYEYDVRSHFNGSERIKRKLNQEQVRWMEFVSEDGRSLFCSTFSYSGRPFSRRHCAVWWQCCCIETKFVSCYFNQNRNPVISRWTTVLSGSTSSFLLFSSSFRIPVHFVVHCWKCNTTWTKTISGCGEMCWWSDEQGRIKEVCRKSKRNRTNCILSIRLLLWLRQSHRPH